MVKRTLSLIPVNLKEAALDSPTFRATAIHFSEQIESIEKWLDSYLKSTVKLCHDVHNLEDVVNTHASRSIPTFASEAVLDHDYTLLALQNLGEGTKDFWSIAFGWCRKLEHLVVDPLTNFQRTDLRTFKESRRTLESVQQKYDILCQRYASQSKTKEPSALREDAFQLHEARKSYIRASFDFCTIAPQLRASLDRILTKTHSDVWREQVKARGQFSLDRHGVEMERIRKWCDSMELSERIFKQELVSARKEIEEQARTMSRPSRELDEYATSTVAFLTSRGREALSTEHEGSEKQGWLFIRTLSGKPVRTIWTRRWFFVKEGIFGWLVQGLRSGGVEESERIGVFLCNIKPAFQEERRFCFEVKTKDTTILLQAETQQDLTSWLAVFESAKRAALDTASTSMASAFAISPPSAPEFAAASLNTDDPVERHGLIVGEGTSLQRASMDNGKRQGNLDDLHIGHTSRIVQKLDFAHRKVASGPSLEQSSLASSSGNVSTNALSMNPSGGIHALISASHGALPLHALPSAIIPSPMPIELSVLANIAKTEPASTLAPLTLANPPMHTNLSKQAVAIGVSTEVDSIIPGGFMANHWGSTNWGYAGQSEKLLQSTSQIGDSSDTAFTTDMSSTGVDTKHRKAVSLDLSQQSSLPTHLHAPEYYPSQYPIALRAQDAQFRILFPNAPKDDKVLLVFRATWNPNNAQEFPGRIYVTMRDIYFYSHYLGLVLISSISLGSIAEVNFKVGKECDFIILHLLTNIDYEVDEDDKIDIKLFLDPVRLLHRRLRLLVQNFNSESQVSLMEMLQELTALETRLDASPESESWEEITMEDVKLGQSNEDTEQNESVGMTTTRGIDGRPKEITRFKLPTVPVLYEPSGMMCKPFEREFDLSSKALFHVMFGDKSAVFQTLYKERRAGHIQQSPWLQQQGALTRREFLYEVIPSRGGNLITRIVDHQIIEKQEDHICYVVADRKIPWHLPHKDRFVMETKFVITHVAKARCKLTIWTAVRWSKYPAFSKGIVGKHALDDLDTDARDLGDVVADQARKLGQHSRTVKAVRIFGQVGAQQQGPFVSAEGAWNRPLASDQQPGAPRLPITQRSLPEIFLESCLSFMQSAISTLLTWTFQGLVKLSNFMQLYWILLLILFLSILMNTQLLTKTTMSYWHTSDAKHTMANIGVKHGLVTAKVVYLQDLEKILLNRTREHGTSQCVSTFRQEARLMNGGNEQISSRGIGSYTRSMTPTARALKISRQRLGIRRHDLLVALRMVNRLESDLLIAEWENWILEENSRCLRFVDVVYGNPTDGFAKGNIKEEVTQSLTEYCSSCREELEYLSSSAFRLT